MVRDDKELAFRLQKPVGFPKHIGGVLVQLRLCEGFRRKDTELLEKNHFVKVSRHDDQVQDLGERLQLFERVDHEEPVLLEPDGQLVGDQIVRGAENADVVLLFEVLLAVEFDDFADFLNPGLHVGQGVGDEVNGDEVIGSPAARKSDEKPQLLQNPIEPFGISAYVERISGLDFLEECHFVAGQSVPELEEPEPVSISPEAAWQLGRVL